MRRTALMLLQHGPLSLAEFTEITGWRYQKSVRVLHQLWLEGLLVKPFRGVYAINE